SSLRKPLPATVWSCCPRSSPRTSEASTTSPGWRRPSAGRLSSGRCGGARIDFGRLPRASARGVTHALHSSRSHMSELQQNGRKTGTIVEIKGVVIDAVFPHGLPEIYNALRIEVPARDGAEATALVAEVQQHLGDDRVRAVAMDSTDGLARGL